MVRKCRVRLTETSSVTVSEETLEIAAEWCGGEVKGLKLPRRDRVVQFWSAVRDEELEAVCGDYIVQLGENDFEVFPREVFHKLFEDVDGVVF